MECVGVNRCWVGHRFETVKHTYFSPIYKYELEKTKNNVSDQQNRTIVTEVTTKCRRCGMILNNKN